MSDFRVANQETYEGTASGAVTINLNRYVRKIVILNDAAASTLQFKFNASEDYATLSATESIALHIRTNTVYLNGNADYRVWAYS